MRGMVDVLRRRGDEHSAYIEPSDAEPLRAEMRQEFGGVGVKIQLDGDPPVLKIVEPPEPGSPAFRSEIRSGDTVIEVDSKPIAGMRLTEILGLMRGAPGEPIVLTILHEGSEDPVAVRLVREVIRVPSVIGDTRRPDGSWRFRLEEDSRVALVRITTFGNRTTEELTETLGTLTSEGVEGILLDVRNNSGGALDTALSVSELFLGSDKLILSTRGRDGEVLDAFSTSGSGAYRDLPIVVLIDRNTASASEIVAAALQDHRRAVVVGERSFGKGTVQQLIPLDSNRSLLKLTSASYWRPSGVNIHRRPNTPESEAWGVSPSAGRAVSMDDEAYLGWLRWRRNRDLLAELTQVDAGANDADEATEVTETNREADPTLLLGLETLQQQLDAS